MTRPAGKSARALTSQQAPTFCVLHSTYQNNIKVLYSLFIVHHARHQAHHSLAQSATKHFSMGLPVVIGHKKVLLCKNFEENLVHV